VIVGVSIYTGFGSCRAQHGVEAVSISNRGLNLLSVTTQRRSREEHVGENFLHWCRLLVGDDDGMGWCWPLGHEVGDAMTIQDRWKGYQVGK
jgi:hypothetical protein